jgi:hypothetical protein
MKPGALRAVAQIVAVLVALILGSTVAAWGPPMPGGLTFIQVVVIAILVLGFAMRKVFEDK